MLTESVDFCIPGSSRIITRTVLYDAGCADSMVRVSSMVEGSHNFDVFRNVQVEAFNGNRERYSEIKQHLLVVKQGNTLTELRVLGVPTLPSTCACSIIIPEVWKDKFGASKLSTTSKPIDMLLGMDVSPYLPKFISHVEVNGEFLSLWQSHLTKAFLIGGKSPQHLSFSGNSIVGARFVQVVEPHFACSPPAKTPRNVPPPFLRDPLRP